MAFVLGLNAKLYRNTGTWAAPSFSLIGNVRDLRLNLEKGEADVTTRAAAGWELVVATLKTAALEFGMVWDTADAAFTAIRNSFLNDTTIELLALDGSSATTGSQGLRADMMVSGFTRNENLREALTADVRVKPTYSVNAPTWYTVP